MRSKATTLGLDERLEREPSKPCPCTEERFIREPFCSGDELAGPGRHYRPGADGEATRGRPSDQPLPHRQPRRPGTSAAQENSEESPVSGVRVVKKAPGGEGRGHGFCGRGPAQGVH